MDRSISVVLGRIETQLVDAVVNAANVKLKQGSGVCGSIFSASGANFLAAACNSIGFCPEGGAVATPGFNLHAKWIIHAVGPRYSDGNHGEREKLRRTYRSILRVADELGVISLAIPAIGTGAFHYPKAEAAQVAVSVLSETPTFVEEILLVAFSQSDKLLFDSQLAAFKIKGDEDE